MCIAAERLGHDLLELGFDFIRRFARREAGTVTDSKNMRVDGERFFPERSVEHHIRRLAPHSGERLQLFARMRDLAVKSVDQRRAERNDVLRFGVEQADCLDRVAQRVLAEIEHPPGIVDAVEQRPAGSIDARVRRLSGEHDGNEQSVGVAILELCRG
jgi:hypothetical protein